MGRHQSPQPTHFLAPLAVALGAIPGALGRYYLGIAIDAATATTLPLGTFTANVLGCFGLGFFTAITIERLPVSAEVRLLVATGFFGSITTFSTFELDGAGLISAGAWWQAGLYGLGSPMIGLITLYLGAALANWMGGRPLSR